MTTYTITGSSTVVGSTAGDTFNLSGTVSNTSLTGSDTTAVAGSDTDQFFAGTMTLTGGVTIDGGVGTDYLYLSYGGTTTLANGQLIVKNIESLSGTLNVTGNSTLDLTGSPTAAMGQINAADPGNFLFTGSSGGGMVRVDADGKGNVRKVMIDPSVVNPADVELLEDLVAAAVSDAQRKAAEAAKGEMSKLTGGLNLPAGFKLPF